MKKIILIITLISTVYPQLGGAKNGAGLTIGDRGVGLSYHHNFKNFDYIKLGTVLRWFDIRPPEEIPSYNYYTGRYENRNTISLAAFPIFGNISYYPFEGKIANNFSPFISVKLGPVLVLDADEEVKAFFKRWSKANSRFTYGGNIAIGVEFRQPGKYYYSIELSYDLIPLNNTIDTYTNLDGTVLSLSLHR